jgi:Carboxypeptidase regulatory-like domain
MAIFDFTCCCSSSSSATHCLCSTQICVDAPCNSSSGIATIVIGSLSSSSSSSIDPEIVPRLNSVGSVGSSENPSFGSSDTSSSLSSPNPSFGSSETSSSSSHESSQQSSESGSGDGGGGTSPTSIVSSSSQSSSSSSAPSSSQSSESSSETSSSSSQSSESSSSAPSSSQSSTSQSSSSSSQSSSSQSSSSQSSSSQSSSSQSSSSQSSSSSTGCDAIVATANLGGCTTVCLDCLGGAGSYPVTITSPTFTTFTGTISLACDGTDTIDLIPASSESLFLFTVGGCGGAALPGATVTIVNGNDGSSQTQTTDSSGSVTFTNLSAGTLTWTASLEPRFQTATGTDTIPECGGRVIDSVTLQPSDNFFCCGSTPYAYANTLSFSDSAYGGGTMNFDPTLGEWTSPGMTVSYVGECCTDQDQDTITVVHQFCFPASNVMYSSDPFVECPSGADDTVLVNVTPSDVSSVALPLMSMSTFTGCGGDNLYPVTSGIVTVTEG